MNQLKEVMMAEEGVMDGRPQKYRSMVCSTENCTQPSLKYCKQCEFLCEQCYDDHINYRITRSHHVITASEGETFCSMAKQVEVTCSVASDKQVEVKEVSRIRVHDQDKMNVRGLVVYHQRVYVVHYSRLTMYCYTADGSLSHTYEHEGGADIRVTGMSLMMDGDTAMLVVSDLVNRALVFIRIIDDVTMEHHHTQQLHYCPFGSYHETGHLMVCDPLNHKIHCYRDDGQTLAVINLPWNVKPMWVTRYRDGDQYVVSDWTNKQVLVIDNNGQVKTHYKGDIHSVKLGIPQDVITDPHRGVLIADSGKNQVLLLRRTGDVVKILDEHVRSPLSMYLDTVTHRLYISGTVQRNEEHVFVFNYTLITLN